MDICLKDIPAMFADRDPASIASLEGRREGLVSWSRRNA